MNLSIAILPIQDDLESHNLVGASYLNQNENDRKSSCLQDMDELYKNTNSLCIVYKLTPNAACLL
jgi:hypothetical protein